MDDDETLKDADDAAEALLLLYEHLGITAVLMTLREDTLLVRCQDSSDVAPLCRKVVKEYEPASDRTLN